MKTKTLLSILAASYAALTASYGQAIISNGEIALGVNPEGHLNVRDIYGVTSNTGYTGVTLIGIGDATSPGCLCEGWGVSATSGGSDYSGYANVAIDGVQNLSLDSFVSDDTGAGPGTFATSSVHLTTLAGLKVTQDYRASTDTSALFVNTVTITNDTGGDVSDVRYVRVMDWDVPPTEFSEFVTIQGTATTTALETSHDNGFSTANPLASTSPLDVSTLNVDFLDNGPADHGAYFLFNFGGLAAGETKEFTIFYGASDTEAGALAALGAVGAELYSLGQSKTPDGPTLGTPATFIFGFKGVGGDVIVPPPSVSSVSSDLSVPDGGASVMLMAMGLSCLTFGKRFLRKQ